MYSQPISLQTYRTKSQQLDQEHFREINPFDEQEGKLHFLHKKPLCIIILGHPCTGKTTLAKKLCQKWRLQLVNATELITQHLSLNTDIGRNLNETLLSGAALSEETVFNLIDQKLNAPECSHYGYVLDDFPAYGKAELTAEQQVQYIFTMKLKPDCIIKIEIPEEDLRSRRAGLKIDPEDGTLFTRRSYETGSNIIGEPQEIKVPATLGSSVDRSGSINLEPNAEADDQEALEEEIEEVMKPSHPDFPQANKEVRERLVVRIEELPEMMYEDNLHYRERVSQHLKYLVSRHNPLKVIELDGNQTPTECFQNFMVRLQAMNVYPSVVPTRFFADSSAEEEEVPEEMETEELFRVLATKKMPGPRCRWRRSPWQRYCPVALYKGILALGKPEFTVGFLGNIFCMHSQEHLASFMANPRPYLLPPQPRPPFRLMVIGPTASGKSTLIRLLAEQYGARVLDLVGLFQEEYDRILSKRLADVEAETEAEVIAEVKERYEQELLALKTSKMTEDAVDDLVDKVAEELEQDAISAVAATVEDEQTAADSTEPPTDMESMFTSLKDSSVVTIVPPRTKEKLYIPKHLREPVDKYHPEVKTRVLDALNRAKQLPVELDVDIYLNAVRAAVEEAEERLRAEIPSGPIRSNWIVDGMPMRPDVWKAFIDRAPDLLPDLVVCLTDQSSKGDFLLKRWYIEGREGLAISKTATSSDSTDKEVSDEIDRMGEELSRVESKRTEELPPGRLRDMTIAKLKNLENQWTQTANLLRSTTTEYGVAIDTLNVDIVDKTFEQLRDEVLTHLQKPFRVEPIEVTQAELEEEEEEDAEAFEEEEDDQLDNEAMGEGEGQEEPERSEDNDMSMAEGEEGEEAEEEVDPSRSADKRLGLTSYFCPVTLHDQDLLRAGNPDIGAQLDGLVYYFASQEARAKFMAAPESILCDNVRPIRVPPPRILILGPVGSGKTLHGSQLASALDAIFVNFDCLLQEIVLPKVGRKLGKEYIDQEPVPDIVLPPLEESDSVTFAPPITEGPTVDRMSYFVGAGAEREELTEHERNIVEYLKNETPLPDTTLEWLLAPYWTREPYISKGFVMEGCPINTEQAQFMINGNYLPELIVVLNAEADEVVGRLLPARLEFWRKKMAKKAANAALLKEWKAAKKELERQKRRAELIAQLQQKRELARAGRRKAETDADEDDELEDEVDIDEMLANDQDAIDEESEPEEKETEADAIERLTEEITERCEESFDKLNEALDQFDEIPVRKIEIDAGGKVTWVRYRLVKRVNTWIENRDALFERVYPVTSKVAERLLANGYKFPSRFGRWCPVTKLTQNSFLPPVCVRPVKVASEKYLTVLPGTVGETLPPANPNTCAAVYKNNVYWFANRGARALFIKNPLKYLQSCPNPPVTLPLRVAIVGAPKTGKTTLAKRLAQEYNVPLINVSDAVHWYLYDPSHAFTSLAERMRTHMDNGGAIPDSMVAAVIQALTKNSIYHTRGYILDGYPITAEQARLLSLNGVRPSLIIELKVTSEEEKQQLVVRAINDAREQGRLKTEPLNVQVTRDESLFGDDDAPGVQAAQGTEVSRHEEGFHLPVSEPDAAEDFAIKLQAYEHATPARNEWLKSHQGILVTLDAVQNRWSLWNQTVRVIRHRMEQLQEYMYRILANKAACIAELGIEERRFQQRVGEFLQFCPVSLKERGELEDTINEPKHELVITLSTEDPLTHSPSCPPDALHLAYPCLVPVEAGEQSNIESAIRIETTLRFAAEYHGRYYRMAGPEELAKFLAKPDQYLPPFVSQTIPSKERLPVRLQADALEMSRDSFPTQVALRGYCPVCFVKSKMRYEGLRLGSREFLARFGGAVYTFCSDNCVVEFLRKPTSYENLQLPNKLPPLPSPVVVKSLPIPGFLEQTVGKSLQAALSAVGQERPKFPFLKIKRSALIYVGLHMKAHNPRSPECERQKYQMKLNDFVDACSLPEWLSRKMPMRFQPKHNRPKKVTTRLESFLNLQSQTNQPVLWSSTSQVDDKQSKTQGTRVSLAYLLSPEQETWEWR